MAIVLEYIPLTVVSSIVFFNILADKAGALANNYIYTAYKKEVFQDTLNYIPNGVLLIDVNKKTVSFRNRAVKELLGNGMS